MICGFSRIKYFEIETNVTIFGAGYFYSVITI